MEGRAPNVTLAGVSDMAQDVNPILTNLWRCTPDQGRIVRNPFLITLHDRASSRTRTTVKTITNMMKYDMACSLFSPQCEKTQRDSVDYESEDDVFQKHQDASMLGLVRSDRMSPDCSARATASVCDLIERLIASMRRLTASARRLASALVALRR